VIPDTSVSVVVKALSQRGADTQSIQQPYLLFLGDAPDMLAVKVARGIVDWRPEYCLGQSRLPGCDVDLGVANMSLEEGRDAGVKTLVVGVVNRGGVISGAWTEVLVKALMLGYDLAAGLHSRLADVPVIAEAASKYDCTLFDVRYPTEKFPVGDGVKRSGKRLLTVGTDCSVGKMYTALALEREMTTRGMDADFRATGQTGILITGSGVSVDAVVSDFISGAVETISPENDDLHWDVIEGQGSLFHASYAGVALGLLHGAQADALMLCHEPTRTHIRGLPDYALPGLQQCMQTNLEHARLTNPDAEFVGISINTSNMSSHEGAAYLKSLEQEFDLPAVDAFKDGVVRIVDKLAS
jgi:D-glutamate N-acetyltransferase